MALEMIGPMPGTKLRELSFRNSKQEHGEQLGILKGKTAAMTGSTSGIGLASVSMSRVLSG
jgi:hypothetical protein